jgi:hypothetical protein
VFILYSMGSSAVGAPSSSTIKLSSSGSCKLWSRGELASSLVSGLAPAKGVTGLLSSSSSSSSSSFADCEDSEDSEGASPRFFPVHSQLALCRAYNTSEQTHV